MTRHLAGKGLTVRRHRASNAASLRSKAPSLAAVLDGAPFGIVITRLIDGRVVHANPRALGMFGFGAREMIGHTTLELGIFASEDARQRMLSDMLDVRPGSCVEVPFRRKDGAGGLAVVTGARFELGVQPHAAWYFEDVTEKLEKDKSRRESEELYRLVIETLAEGVVVLDRETRIVASNGSAQRILGLKEDEISGRKTLDPSWRAIREDGSAFPPEEYPAVLTIRTGMPHSGVVMGVPRPNGPLSWISINSRPLPPDESGGPSGCVASFTDVTARKQDEEERRLLERQLLQSQKMEAIGTLAGGIAHDFNNILFAIQGNAEMARLELAPGEPARSSLDEVQRACERAKALVQRLLAFSRRHETKKHPLRIGPVVAETVKLMKSTLPADVDLVQAEEGEDALVMADEVEIQQVVMNLCTNAIHSMRDAAGRIVLRHGAVDVDAAQAAGLPGIMPGRHVRLAVSDAGKGIDEAVLGRIFDPFFTTKPAGEGTGLGLAVVRQVVASHDGAISVKSAIGEGTTFEVYLPVTPGGAIGPVPPAADDAAPPGNRILFVDDDPAIVRLADRLLSRAGFEVRAVGSASEALEILRPDPGRFDLVLSDISMPRMSGLELAAEIRRLRPGLPVVFTTGDDAPIDADAARELGVREIVHKPWTTAQLVAALMRHLGERAGG